MNGSIETESLRLAMNEAWEDHHHTRDQTWKALQAEIVIFAGIIGINWQVQNTCFIVLSCILLFIVSLCGIQITLRHRNKVEIRKFGHILRCEEKLGLHQKGIIDDVELPKSISFWDAFRPNEGNTSLFILRMHIAILLISFSLMIYMLINLL